MHIVIVGVHNNNNNTMEINKMGAKNAQNNNSNAVLEKLQKYQKHISHNGGGVGQGGQVVGLWEDKAHKNRHISVGGVIEKHTEYVLSVQNNKIVIAQLSEKEKEIAKNAHIKTYSTSGVKSYICITQGDTELWEKMVQVWGGVYKEKINTTQGKKMLEKVQLCKFSEL